MSTKSASFHIWPVNLTLHQTGNTKTRNFIEEGLPRDSSFFYGFLGHAEKRFEIHADEMFNLSREITDTEDYRKYLYINVQGREEVK